MDKSRHVIVRRLKPIFTSLGDVPTRLRSYSDPKFSIRLFGADHEPLTGEVRPKVGAQDAAALLEGLKASTASSGSLDPTRNRTRKDIADVLESEQQVLSGAISFSYSDGVFEFSKSIHCDDGFVESASLLLMGVALEFLQTLGSVTDCKRADTEPPLG